MSRRVVTAPMRFSAILACFLSFSTCVFAHQMPQDDAQLVSEDWHDRAAAFYSLRATLKGASADQGKDQFLVLLARENRFLDSRSNNSNVADSKSRLVEEENYAEYYAQVLESANAASDLRNPHDLSILLASAYNPDSPFARQLVDQGRENVIPILLQLANNNSPAKRANALVLLGYGYSSLADMATTTRDEVRKVLMLGTHDADPMVRQEVVRVMGQTHDASFLETLLRVSKEDNASYTIVAGGNKRFPVREEALKAIKEIEIKKH
jgi:hypothetical protein